jgi:SAM-dependent methyltransferase
MLEEVSKRSNQIKALYHVALHKLRQDGANGVLKRCIEELRQKFRAAPGRTESAFDHEFGTNTDGIVPLWKLHIQSPYREQGVRYQASDPAFVRTAIENLPIRPEEFVYIDIGSGKGLTLLVASEYPFRRVLGVEFSAELNSLAAENIRRHQTLKRRCLDVSSIFADAASYEFPIENMILFLYNPFGRDVLRRLLENLRSSLVQSDREVYMVYSNPIFVQLLEESDFLERIEVPVNAAVYRHTFKSP